MMPPTCCFCDTDLDPGQGGGLITFARSASDEAWYQRAKDPHFAGHPPNVAWFCPSHHERAGELSSRTLAEALRIMREESPSGS